MATTNFYLDARAVKRGEPAPLKVSITKNGRTSYLSLDIRILPSQWDRDKCKVKDHPNKNALNSYIQSRKQTIDSMLMKLTAEGELVRKSAVQIKHIIAERLSPEYQSGTMFITRFKTYAESREKQRTRDLYNQTLSMMMRFDSKVQTLSFEQITKDWLMRFDKFLQNTEPSQNTRSIHFRNIRAVFNDAIDDEITTNYPFRKYMVNMVATAKRAYTVDTIRELFAYPVLPHEAKYVDMFKLILFLIGINAEDLFNLTEVVDGRIIYSRSKTSRLYNIKVEPEAQAIIDKYRGTDKLLNVTEKFANTHNYLSTLNRALKQIGPRTHEIINGKKTLVYHTAFPGLSTYVARHTWATLAAEIDIPDETIEAALGHGVKNKTTAIYIDRSIRKVDEANRKVIDYILNL